MKQSLVLFSLFAIFSLTLADIPVHCLKTQITGDWTFSTTEPVLVTDPYQMNCGHQHPDDPASSYLADSNSFVEYQSFPVTLNDDYTVNSEGSHGHWTMIYDEGFYAKLNEHQYTAYFYYFKDDDTGEAMSYCGKTVVGWFEELDTGKKACFRAVKDVTPNEEEELYVTPIEEMYVVSPTSSTNLLQMNAKATSKSKLKSKSKHHHKKDQNLLADVEAVVDHAAIVEKINMLQTTWTAKAHSRFHGKSLKEMNKLAGHAKGILYENSSAKHAKMLEQINMENVDNDVTDLPKSYDWSSKLPPVRDQGDCGSCYVFSTMEMASARLNIHYGIDVQLSPQHVLDCSFHNQGCNGGYPFLVGKFGNEFELVQESCAPYQGEQGNCEVCDVNSQSETYKLENYRYVGGAYGKSNERNMMIELMNHGPFVVSFEPTTEFMYYNGGVFQSTPALWEQEGLPQPEWEQVDHAVLLYGWGETDDGTKYWMVMNSWGTDWGENGTFRILRGKDECAIESIAEASDVSVVNRTP